MDLAPCEGCALHGRPSMDPPRPEQKPGGVFFLGGFPDYGSVAGKERLPFYGRRTQVLRMIVDRKRVSLNPVDRPQVTYGYSCWCSPDYNRDTRRYDISVREYGRCAAITRDYIDLQRPDLIVAMGVDAYRLLGLRGTTKDLRGRPAAYKDKNGREIPVMPTFDLGTVVKNTGLMTLFESDVEKALRLGGNSEPTPNRAIVAMTADEVVAELDRMNDMLTRAPRKPIRGRTLAFDTETSSLHPHDLRDRIIAMSFSLEDHVGLAFPYQHRDHLWTDEELARIRAAVERLLTNPNMVMATANGGFDLKWLWARGIATADHKWDIILAEHLLDEAKQGEYSLKDITRLRFPEYGNYEEEITNIRLGVWAEKDRRAKELRKEAKEATSGRVFEWWLGLGDEGRQARLAEWIRRGLVRLTETRGLAEIKFRKLKGEMVPTKKSAADALKFLGRLPEGEVPEELRVDAVVPEDLQERSFEDIPLDKLLLYAAMDAITTRLVTLQQQDDVVRDYAEVTRLRNIRGIQVRPLVDSFKAITMPLSVELARMELHGIRFDRERAKEFQRAIDERTAEIEERMFTEAGYRFNPQATADLVKLLYTDLELPVTRRTSTSSPSVDEDTLKDLYEAHRDLTILDDIISYRKLSKTSRTYLRNWLAMSELDGRIRCEFKQTGTVTYRLSSANPNLQNVPFSLNLPGGGMLNLKSLFLPDEGFDIYDLDIKNAEMRVLCAYSRDEHLISAFNEGKDLHSLTAAGISGMPYEQICEHKEDKTRPEYTQRQVAKKVNFGTIYCMSGKTLKENLWNDNRISVTEVQAEEYLENFFLTYPGVRRYIKATQDFVDEWHFAHTFFGRRRRFPYSSYLRNDRERVHRQAVNARIQGTSSDIVMSCLIRLNRWLRSRGDGSQVLLTVHDSMPFQAPHGAHEGIRAMLDEIIVESTARECPWLPVRWEYDCGWGPNYGDTHGAVT